MYHHKSWGCTTTNLFGVLHKSHIFPHRAPSGAGVGISRLRPSMESYGPPAVILQLYPIRFCYCIFNCGKCEMDLSELKDFGPSLHFKALLVESGRMNVVLWGINSLCILMHMFKNWGNLKKSIIFFMGKLFSTFLRTTFFLQTVWL